MKTLKEQQEEAWRLAPEDAKWIAQDNNGNFWWYSYQPEINEQEQGWGISINLSDKEEWLCHFEVNGWDWRDTLQTREEWEAMSLYAKCAEPNCNAPIEGDSDLCITHKMNVKDEKWMPEVGQEFSVNPVLVGDAPVKAVCVGYDGEAVVGKYINSEGAVDYYAWLPSQIIPIQTPADKDRDEQIDAIYTTLLYVTEDINKQDAENLFEHGVRVLGPDEFPAKRLTDEQVTNMKANLKGQAASFVIETVLMKVGAKR